MKRKSQEVSYDFDDVYKELPLEMRVRVNLTAAGLLEIQKENNAFRDDRGDRSVGDGEDGGKGDEL